MRYFYILFIALLVASCSESKMLQSSLRNFKSSIGYIHDTPKVSCVSSDSLFIRLNNTPLDTVTTVSKLNGLVLPFIVFNHVQTNMNVKLGQSSINEDFNDFFTSSLKAESKRTGCYNLTDRISSDSIYTLDLSIDTCNTYSKYSKSTTVIFLFVAYSMSFNEYGSPAQTSLQVTAKLRKGGRQVYVKKYTVNRVQPFIQSRLANTNQLRADFTSNMVEALSLSTKECVEEIVNDMNLTLGKSGMPRSEEVDEEKTADTQIPVVNSVMTETKAPGNINNGSKTTLIQKTELAVGDQVKFYNYGFNDYINGVVKEIKQNTVIVEYLSFGKMKTLEVNRSEIKEKK